MKYIVDNLPKTKEDCDQSEWNRRQRDYICKRDGKICNLDEGHPITSTSCRWLKVQ